MALQQAPEASTNGSGTPRSAARMMAVKRLAFMEKSGYSGFS
jgi:hypothetical protein